MAGRGKRLLDNIQKIKQQKEEEEATTSPPPGPQTAGPSAPTQPKPSAAPTLPKAGLVTPTQPPAGRGRGVILLAAQTARAESPPREPSDSSSSGQPSPSGAIGSPPEDLEVTEEVEAMSLQRRVFPTQPPPIMNKLRGTDGLKIQLTLNVIKLTQRSGFGIFEHSITFSPQIDSRQLRAKILRQTEVIAQIGTTYQFTGMNLYLPKQLIDISITTTTPADGTEVMVRLQFIKAPPFHELIPFYNTTFRKIMRELKLVQIQRHYYDPTSRIDVPQHKLEIWPGWCTSVQDLDDGLLLTCDASHRLLRTSTAKEVLQELFRLPDGRQRFKEMAQKRLIGCIVLTRYNNKPYRVDDIAFDQNPNSTFDWNGTQVTYVEYFRRSWEIEIKDMKQPLLVHRPKPKRGETESRMVCLIPELSFMTGLTDDIRADNRAMKDIAAHTRIKPAVRQQKLQEFIKNVLSNPDARRHLTDWGLDLAPTPYQSEGRTMAADRIMLGNDVKVAVSARADWSREATTTALYNVVDITKWLMIYTKRDSSKVDEFVKSLKTVTRQMGFKFEDPDRIEARDDSALGYVMAIKDKNAPQHQIIVTMTPGSSQREDRYNAIKRLCYCEIGKPSQVVRANTLSDAKMRSVCQKIAIQMNCKVGGQPWAIPIPLKSCMIVGLDVYHDPSQRGKSVVGMVSSMNIEVSQWYSRVFFQNSHDEIVNTLETGIKASLRKWYDNNNQSLPQRIFIFRDGVSDGQLSHVLDYEVAQVQNALQDFGKAYKYEPTLTYIVVQKRINAKLLMKGRAELENPPPGSVVDHSITRKNFYDFYLISQYVTQGTVTPTHYIIVHDTNEMPPDRIQKLSYKLTHLYYNWFGTIRVPAPCQYAHKAAYMVGQVIKKSPAEYLADKLYFL